MNTNRLRWEQKREKEPEVASTESTKVCAN